MNDIARYLKDLDRAPDILSAIRAAKLDPTHTVHLSIRQFADDPFLLFAAAALAAAEGVHLFLKASQSSERPNDLVERWYVLFAGAERLIEHFRDDHISHIFASLVVLSQSPRKQK